MYAFRPAAYQAVVPFHEGWVKGTFGGPSDALPVLASFPRRNKREPSPNEVGGGDRI